MEPFVMYGWAWCTVPTMLREKSSIAHTKYSITNGFWFVSVLKSCTINKIHFRIGYVSVFFWKRKTFFEHWIMSAYNRTKSMQSLSNTKQIHFNVVKSLWNMSRVQSLMYVWKLTQTNNFTYFMGFPLHEKKKNHFSLAHMRVIFWFRFGKFM